MMTTDQPADAPKTDKEWAEKIETEKGGSIPPAGDTGPSIVLTDEPVETEEKPPVTEPPEVKKVRPPKPDPEGDKEFDGCADLRENNTMAPATPDEIETLFQSLLENIPEADRVKVMQDPTSLVHRLYRLVSSSFCTGQAELSHGMLEQSNKAGQLKNSMELDFKDRSSSGKKKYNKRLTGKEAAMAFTAKLQGMKKVFLYNSGFHIDLKPFSLDVLNEFFQSIDQESTELGRILGGHFYLLHDHFIRSKFMELLPVAVVGSNLTNWDRGSTLADNISVHDYDTCLWAVCSMMYKDGIRLASQCINTECVAIDDRVKYELDRMRVADMAQLTEPAMEMLLSNDMVKPADLAKYRSELLEHRHAFVDGEIRYHLKVPTMGEVLEFGSGMMARIAARIHDDMSVKNDTVSAQILIHYKQSFIPWIEKIAHLDAAGEEEFVTDEKKAMEVTLAIDPSNPSDETVMQEMKEYMKRTRISHICYAAAPCGQCGREHPETVDGMRGFDVQHLFFTLTYHVLDVIGIES